MARRYDEPKVPGHEHEWWPAMDTPKTVTIHRRVEVCNACGWRRWCEIPMSTAEGRWVYLAPGDPWPAPPAGFEMIVWLDPKLDPPPFKMRRTDPALLAWVSYAGAGGHPFVLPLNRANGEWVIRKGGHFVKLPTTIEVIAWAEGLRGPSPEAEEAGADA